MKITLLLLLAQISCELNRDQSQERLRNQLLALLLANNKPFDCIYNAYYNYNRFNKMQ